MSIFSGLFKSREQKLRERADEVMPDWTVIKADPDFGFLSGQMVVCFNSEPTFYHVPTDVYSVGWDNDAGLIDGRKLERIGEISGVDPLSWEIRR